VSHGPQCEGAWRHQVNDEAAVCDLAAVFAGAVRPPAVIYLRGDLGAGKTTFARAYIHALGFEGYVKSPSYGLLELYQAGGQRVLHLDLYRIEDPEELEYLAIRDQFDDTTVLLVEWPDRGAGRLPAPDLVLHFVEEGSGRIIECEPVSPTGLELSERVLRNIR
jgi:tRNA threonylcarbamoyladenosine biosynthesis protein TsaE